MISLARTQTNYITHILLRVLKYYARYHVFYLILSYIQSMIVRHHIFYLISSYITFNLIWCMKKYKLLLVKQKREGDRARTLSVKRLEFWDSKIREDKTNAIKNKITWSVWFHFKRLYGNRIYLHLHVAAISIGRHGKRIWGTYCYLHQLKKWINRSELPLKNTEQQLTSDELREWTIMKWIWAIFEI